MSWLLAALPLAAQRVSRIAGPNLPALRSPTRRGMIATSLMAASLSGGPAEAASGFVDETVVLSNGQQITARRFVEADVGMSFPKTSLDEKLFSRPWPEEYPFPPQAFRRQDETDDGNFYADPRLVYHIDEGAVRSLTNYYKSEIKPGSAVLDICSSWVSHYPTDFPEKMERIAGTGMNAFELEANKQLSDYKPRDLNIEPTLPYGDAEFDVVTCVVSVDYLNKPLAVFKEVRVRPCIQHHCVSNGILCFVHVSSERSPRLLSSGATRPQARWQVHSLAVQPLLPHKGAPSSSENLLFEHFLLRMETGGGLVPKNSGGPAPPKRNPYRPFFREVANDPCC